MAAVSGNYFPERQSKRAHISSIYICVYSAQSIFVKATLDTHRDSRESGPKTKPSLKII